MMSQELQESAAAIVAALVRVEQSAGAEASAEVAAIMMRLATLHILTSIDPQAAKAALVRLPPSLGSTQRNNFSWGGVSGE
jgi:hypothetical protein